MISEATWPAERLVKKHFSGNFLETFRFSCLLFVPACSRFHARRLRFLRTAPRATRGDAREGFGSAKDVPPGAMAPKALESAPPFLRKVCVRASRTDQTITSVLRGRMARFSSREGAPETDPTPFPMQVPHGGRLDLRRHRVMDREWHAVHDSPDERVRQRAVAEVLQAQKLQLVRAATQLLRGCTRDFTRGRGSPNGPGGAPARLSMRTRPDSTLSTTARPRSWAVSPAHPRNARGAAVTPLVFNRFPPADRRVPLPRAQGFRKANNRFWAFANAHFRKDCEPHLVNIKRRQGAKAKADPGPSTGVRLEPHARVTCFFHESF